MGVSPKIFSSAGQISTHYRPGAYSRRNFIPNAGGGVSTGNVCILGPSELGKPMELLVFANANDARAALGSGDLLEAVIQAFNPGNDLVPQQIGVVRVNKGTQSERTLQATAADIFTVKSFDYGATMNQVRLKFSAGTIAGTHKVETEYKGTTYEDDNVEKKSFTIQYVGAGSAATMTINGTQLTTSVTGGPGGEDLTLVFSSFPTITEIVAAINNNSAYTATIDTGTPTDLCSELDAVTAQDILTSTYTAKSDIVAILAALQSADYLSDVEYVGASRIVPDYDADFIYLAGGTYGPYTTTEWNEALTYLERQDIQLVATPSTELSIHVLIKDHCVKTNSVEGKAERQFYVGGGTGEDVATLKSNALTLNSSFGSLCTPGYYQFNDLGVKTLYAPSFYGCKQVGMLSALALNNPTTWKNVNILEWEKEYTDPEQDELIPAGVLIGAKKRDNTFITVRSVTTNQGSNLQENEASIMRETLFQDRDLRTAIENALVGTPLIGDRQLATVDTIFEQKIAQWYQLGIIVPGNDGSLYSGYTRVIDGDTIRIEYNTYNTAPNNFVFITHNVEVLSQG